MLCAKGVGTCQRITRVLHVRMSIDMEAACSNTSAVNLCELSLKWFLRIETGGI
jgi:hypothetical protein